MSIMNKLNSIFDIKSMRLCCVVMAGLPLAAISSQTASAADQETIAEAASGLEMRSIGPALMGGRIADIAVHPSNSSLWYVASASGGVWKTGNAGITWTPIFDSETAYSIADVSIDPGNPDVIWVGTGENVSGRHVGWGDGVYKSTDSGKNWTNVDLKNSEHIGKILIDSRGMWIGADKPDRTQRMLRCC